MNAKEVLTPPAGDARVRLRRSATELFGRNGYAATTVRGIVEAAGVTKPALHYHFKNKEGLYLELMQASYARFPAILDESPGKSGCSQKSGRRRQGDRRQSVGHGDRNGQEIQRRHQEVDFGKHGPPASAGGPWKTCSLAVISHALPQWPWSNALHGGGERL